MEINEKKLNEIPYLDYLKWMLETAQQLSHSNKSDSVYNKAMTLIQSVILRYISENKLSWGNYFLEEEGNNLRKDQEILCDYPSNGADKRKRAVINEFKEELSYDLQTMIINIERQ
jgi:hypothetical protein